MSNTTNTPIIPITTHYNYNTKLLNVTYIDTVSDHTTRMLPKHTITRNVGDD